MKRRKEGVSLDKRAYLDQFAKTREDRVLLAHILDQAQKTAARNLPTHTPFLTPSQCATVSALLDHYPHTPNHLLWGGYPQAQRKCCLFLPTWQEDLGEDCPLAAVQAVPGGHTALTHRDYLGSLMGLGLTRDRMGDLLVDANRCQAIVFQELVPILLSQWERVGSVPITLTQIPLDQLDPPPLQIQSIQTTVSSLRLDSVLAAGFSTSRSKACQWIASGRVSLNHQECGKADQLVSPGDTLSCRGLGKGVLYEVLGSSRKGRIILHFHRYQ